MVTVYLFFEWILIFNNFLVKDDNDNNTVAEMTIAVNGIFIYLFIYFVLIHLFYFIFVRSAAGHYASNLWGKLQNMYI